MIPDKISSVVYGGEKIFTAVGEKITVDGVLEIRNEFTECGENAYEWVTRFRNAGNANTKQLSGLNGADLPFETDEKTITFESLRGDSCGGQSFLPIKYELDGAKPLEIEPSGGRSSSISGFPFFDIKAGDKSLICAIGWTGQWLLKIVKNEGGFRITVGLRDADFYLKPGETARTPRILVMYGGADIEKLRRDFRRLMLKKYSPHAIDADFRVPVALQNYDRFYLHDVLIHGDHWTTEKVQLEAVELAAKCGMDSYWLDAAWFIGGFTHKGVGNYGYEASFPNGLKKIAERIHAHGMKFVLWFEPERPYLGTDTAKKWKNCLLTDNPRSDFRLLDYSADGVLDWVFEKLSSVIEENGVDVYRQDFNTDPLPYWRKKDKNSKYLRGMTGVLYRLQDRFKSLFNKNTGNRYGLTEMKHVEAMYELWDRLKQKFPKLVIDNCSSGGRRIDLETCMRAIPLWRSDTGCFCSSEKQPSHIWNQNQTMSLARYLPFQSIASWVPEANEFRSAATMGIACNFNVFDPEFNFEKAKNAIDEIHSLQKIWEGDFYAFTEPALNPEAWAGFQLNRENEGFCVFFRRNGENDTYCFAINTFNTEAEYSVTVSNEQYNKTEMMLKGSELKDFCKKIRLFEKNSSLLLVYRKE